MELSNTTAIHRAEAGGFKITHDMVQFLPEMIARLR